MSSESGSDRAALLRLVGVLVLVSIVPLVVFTVVSLDQADRAVRHEVDAKLRTATETSSELVRSDMSGLSELVASYASRPLLGDAVDRSTPAAFDHGVVQSHLEALLDARRGITGAFVATPDCRVTDVLPARPALLGADLSQRDWCRGVTAKNGTYVSEAFRAAAESTALAVEVAAPLRPARAAPTARPAAYLVAVYSLASIQSYVARLTSAEGVSLTITDQRGNVVAGPSNPAAATDLVTARDDPRVQAALGGQAGLLRTGSGANDTMAAYGPVPGLGWTATAEIRADEALAGVARLRRSVIGIAVIVGLVLITAIALVALTLRRRQAAERSAAENQARSLAILEAANDAFVAMDADGRILEWNGQAEELFGWPREEAIGRPVATTIIPEGLRDAHARGLKRFLATGDGPVLNVRTEIAAQHRDGHEVPVELLIWPISAGSSWKFNAFIHDISVRKAYEAEIAAARDAALDASRLKSEFLANMSHEIRTPMNGVLGMTSLLLDTDLDADQRMYAETVRGSGESLLEILNDILDLSKIEAGRLDIEVIDFDLRALVEEVADVLSLRAHAKGLELLCVLPDHLPPAVRGDPGRLRQILTNLVGNAVKFTEAGEVVIEMTMDGEPTGQFTARFEVRDTGIGISPDDQGHLFQSFSQADSSTTRKYGGTGLGLAISRQLVGLMGGSIGVESTVGVGSTFWYSIPLEATDAKMPPEPPHLDGLRALVVDDNATNRTIVSRFLATWGMTSVLADGPAEAMALLREAHDKGEVFDIALLDLHMNEVDGIGLARQITSSGLTSMPLVLLTSSGQPGEAAAAREAGMAGYLPKPIRRAQLYDTIASVLRGANAKTAAPRRPRPVGASKGRILVAEDNAVNQLVASGIVRALGYDVEVVADGRAAVEAVLGSPYDAVLMDCQMPGVDGYEATLQIRGAEKPPTRTRVIAVTASAMPADRDRCLAAGMDDYIAKPVSMESVGAALDRWVGGASEVADGAGSTGTGVSGGGAGGNSDVLDPDVVGRLRALGNSAGEDLFAELTEMYVHELPERIEKLRSAAEAGDGDSLVRTAHALRGSSANIGATVLAGLCADLETGRATLSSAELVAQIEAEAVRVVSALRASGQPG